MGLLIHKKRSEEVQGALGDIDQYVVVGWRDGDREALVSAIAECEVRNLVTVAAVLVCVEETGFHYCGDGVWMV